MFLILLGSVARTNAVAANRSRDRLARGRTSQARSGADRESSTFEEKNHAPRDGVAQIIANVGATRERVDHNAKIRGARFVLELIR